MTTAEATGLVRQRLWGFFVEVTGKRAEVIVSNRGGTDYLTTSPDGIAANNLDNLPSNPRPVSGALPGFPLSIPGAVTMSLMQVSSVRYAAAGQLRSLIANVLRPSGAATRVVPPSSFWTQRPRWLYFDVLIPFPCEVAVDQGLQLTKVPGDAPAARRALEDAGKGWWSIDYVLTRPDGTLDLTKPSRITEARIIVRPSDRDWTSGRVYLGVSCFSLNAACYSPEATSRSGSGVGITLTKPAAPAAAPTPKVTVPNVVGQRLDLALSTLWAAKFKVTVVGPTDMSTNLRVVSQSLNAGTTVQEGAGILLSTTVISAAPGVKGLAITNQSNRAAAVDIWLFEHLSGSWTKTTKIDYQASGQVTFDDGHVYSVAAIDGTSPLCHTSRPDEVSCVYATPARTFEGDKNGSTLPWTIT